MAADDHTPATEAAGLHGELARTLGPLQLIAIGIGAIIGTGIFVITGTAAATYAGPAVIISFIIAGTGCVFAGLCYAELAAMIPVSGSAYTYAYAAFGRFAAWVIGWDLVLEYGVSASTVAVGWSGYFGGLMKDFGLPALPEALSSAPVAFQDGAFVFTGALINLPAVAIVILLSALLMFGVRSSANANGLMVFFKVAVVLLVILFGLPLIHAQNLDPFIPPNTGKFGEFGWSGILRASGVIFFAYIGFDAVSVAAQESRNPQRDMPIGILGSLAICTVLYLLMSLTMVGLTSYTNLKVPNPVSVAIAAAGPELHWLGFWVNIGAIVGLSTVILVSLYGQSRIFYSMARDGMLPQYFAKVHPVYGTPVNGTFATCIGVCILAAFLPLDILGELVSIGTLLAFVLVCIGVIVLRFTKPNVVRPFRTPGSPIVPLLGVAFCGAMMFSLPPETIYRLVVWFGIGLLIYAMYGVRHAKKPVWSLDDAPQKEG